MHKLTLAYLMILCCLLAAPVAQAEQLKVPEKLNKSELILVGDAQFSVLFWDIYYSRLYTSSGKYQGVVPKLLFEIHYQRELIDSTIEQWQHLQMPAQAYQAYIPLLTTLWPDIKEGDTLAFVVDQQSSQFYFNGDYLGLIDEQAFAETFLAIWLSPDTSQPKLRQQLIGDIDE